MHSPNAYKLIVCHKESNAFLRNFHARTPLRCGESTFWGANGLKARSLAGSLLKPSMALDKSAASGASSGWRSRRASVSSANNASDELLKKAPRPSNEHRDRSKCVLRRFKRIERPFTPLGGDGWQQSSGSCYGNIDFRQANPNSRFASLFDR